MGMFTHYANRNHGWKTLAQPIDALLAYPGEYSLRARCDDSGALHSFWNMIEFPIHVLNKSEDKNKMLDWSLMGLLPDPVRMGGPSIRGRVFGSLGMPL